MFDYFVASEYVTSGVNKRLSMFFGDGLADVI
jgi:hypothetical protein